MERKVFAITEMHKNIKTSVIIGTRSKEFEVKVGVHQGSVRLCWVKLQITKDIEQDGAKELLYADDLVLLGDSWKEVEKRYAWWEKAKTEIGLKVNVKKTKALVLVKELYQFMEQEWKKLYLMH